VPQPQPADEPAPTAAKETSLADPTPSLAVPKDRASDFVPPALIHATSQLPPDNNDKPQPTLSIAPSTPTQGPQSTKTEPELPMPKLVAAKIKQPDFDESALLLPKTRQEALTALGVGETAGEDVIERVVAGLRQCWRPDESNDKDERTRRLQRMQQIETAWRILSDQPTKTEQHGKHPAN